MSQCAQSGYQNFMSSVLLLKTYQQEERHYRQCFKSRRKKCIENVSTQGFIVIYKPTTYAKLNVQSTANSIQYRTDDHLKSLRMKAFFESIGERRPRGAAQPQSGVDSLPAPLRPDSSVSCTVWPSVSASPTICTQGVTLLYQDFKCQLFGALSPSVITQNSPLIQSPHQFHLSGDCSV